MNTNEESKRTKYVVGTCPLCGAVVAGAVCLPDGETIAGAVDDCCLDHVPEDFEPEPKTGRELALESIRDFRASGLLVVIVETAERLTLERCRDDCPLGRGRDKTTPEELLDGPALPQIPRRKPRADVGGQTGTVTTESSTFYLCRLPYAWGSGSGAQGERDALRNAFREFPENLFKSRTPPFDAVEIFRSDSGPISIDQLGTVSGPAGTRKISESDVGDPLVGVCLSGGLWRHASDQTLERLRRYVGVIVEKLRDTADGLYSDIVFDEISTRGEDPDLPDADREIVASVVEALEAEIGERIDSVSRIARFVFGSPNR